MPLELQPGPRGSYRIDGFRSGRFLVGGKCHDAGILIWPAGVCDLFEALTPAAFEPLLAVRPELDIILIGTGAALRWPSSAIRDVLLQRGIGSDVMTSQLAARTYNVLAGEGRQAGALLLPLEA